MKKKYRVLVNEGIISEDDLSYYEFFLERAYAIYERLKKLNAGKTCIWFWTKPSWKVKAWMFFIIFRKDIDVNKIAFSFKELKPKGEIKTFDHVKVRVDLLQWPNMQDLDGISSLMVKFENGIAFEMPKEIDPNTISRKIQSIITKLFSSSEFSKNSFCPNGVFENSELPSSEAQTSEAKEAESSSSAESNQEVSLYSSEFQAETSEDEKLNPDPTSRQKSQSLEPTDSDQDQLESCPDPSKTVSEIDSEAGEAEGKLGREDQASPPESSMDSGDLSPSHPEVECQSETPGADTGAGSPASGEDGASSPFSEQSEKGEIDSLDSLSPGALSGQEGSCIETGQDSSTSSKESGSLWEVEFNPEESQHSYGGGGGQAKALSAEDSNSKIEKQVALLLRRLFSSIEDLFKKREGKNFWDAKKVICSSTFAPQNLPASKFSRPSFRKISLWVDVSGSVAHLARFIISLITAASKDKDVQIVVGSEAHPEKVLPDNFHKLNLGWWAVDGVWEHDYVHEFEAQVEIFLRRNRLERGSLIVIWSDYMDIHAKDLSKLARFLKPYSVVWLCSHDQDYDSGYHGNESFKLEKFARKEGHLFLWSIDSPEGIRKAIKYLSVKKK